MFWSIYKKEMLDSMRDRKQIFLSIVIPIVMMLAMTLFYENVMLSSNEDKVYTVAVSSEMDEKSVAWMNELPNMAAIVVADPEQAVRDGDAAAGLWADVRFLEKIEQGEPVEVKIVADSSSMNGSITVDRMERYLNEFEQLSMTNRLEQHGIDPVSIQPLTVTPIELAGKDSTSLSLASLLLPMLIVMSVMIGGQGAATELFAGEKERKTMEALLMTPVNRGTLVMAKWLAISTIGFISGVFAIFGFVAVVFTMTERLKTVLDFGDTAGSLLVSALLSILIFAALVAAIQIIFSLFAKTFKEAQSYFGPVMFLAMVPYFVLIGTGVNELTTIHFLIPVMNTYALLKELVYGIFSVPNLLMTLASSAAFVGVMYAIAAIMFSKDKWVLGK